MNKSVPAKIVIATRESPLALWQAEHIKALLENIHAGCDVSLLGMKTKGDKILDKSLSKVGGKGLFIKELEVALMDGRADIAVHSGKDVPMLVPEGMAMQIVDQRADSRDALVLPATTGAKGPANAGVLNNIADLANVLPEGAVVGTSSLRRQCQLLALRPDITVRSLRGNLNTRLRKLDQGEFHAIILAAAGLQRLGFSERISAIFSPELLLPAVAQGALAIEYTASREIEMSTLLAPLVDVQNKIIVSAERAFNLRLEGSCQTPLAGHAVISESGGQTKLTLNALVGSEDGSEILRAEDSIDVSSTINNSPELVEKAEQLGLSVAEELLKRGADRLLRAAEA